MSRVTMCTSQEKEALGIWQPAVADNASREYERGDEDADNGGKEKERKKSLTRGHVEDIGSTMGIQSYEGQGYEGVMS